MSYGKTAEHIVWHDKGYRNERILTFQEILLQLMETEGKCQIDRGLFPGELSIFALIETIGSIDINSRFLVNLSSTFEINMRSTWQPHLS